MGVRQSSLEATSTKHPGEGEFLLQNWIDLTAGEAGPTTAPCGGREGRRIDRAFCNQACLALAPVARLRWDLGLATHAGIEVRLRLGPPPPYPARLRPKPLSGAAKGTWTVAGAAAAVAEAWGPHAAALEGGSCWAAR